LVPKVEVGAVVDCGAYPIETAGKLGYIADTVELCLEIGDIPCDETGEWPEV
jgi:hypothetical protein